MKTFHLTIASLDKSVFDGFVTRVTVPGSEGEMTILADHVPLISRLSAGTITCTDAAGDHTFAVTHGVLEVGASRATILI
ncbi:hypothetical protein A3C89_00430 [Candidatus Kaiserbacteria bacterium RIFCSPHIGHO2_02_FULL_50_50]|uniref:ATP synthase F1 complex delta/epsilon subunit N-terminal domain-containing protein n=1 Tax=Candidatus Kaiserbacteria bacterium RIFCSPHIGHO2_02_FULL_50_50 TaxID=1798492 RepID=A0A1F6DE65_9BACT|nr:MAG: hypothetical protein A3C89_00430 [Candidatus Kaiserbacteria bacterium RIFCSPHIGHO2_02_FULL_50_50]OGG89208.1 MAG: hypothetical protein A3G62_01110 [Candidatus Kaiserbacteria bacterium RIFCSPLOWO2_12_FULL_50_10]